MRGVNIESACGIELCERIEDREGTVIYVDPPYLEKGADYVHNFKAEDHQRLATALRQFTRTRVIVSYYSHPRLAELYPGWTKLECTITKSMGRWDKNGRTEAPEVLLINGPAFGNGGELF
jgi:DNA adenine methylase